MDQTFREFIKSMMKSTITLRATRAAEAITMNCDLTLPGTIEAIVLLAEQIAESYWEDDDSEGFDAVAYNALESIDDMTKVVMSYDKEAREDEIKTVLQEAIIEATSDIITEAIMENLTRGIKKQVRRLASISARRAVSAHKSSLE